MGAVTTISVTTFSPNARAADFTLVGGIKDVAPEIDDSPDSPKAQAAWLRNHRRALAALAETDFVLVGGVAEGDDLRYALLKSHHNPRRNLLHPVCLASNNRRVTAFKLVGNVKNLPCDESDPPEAHAAWLRNHRRSLEDKEPAAVELRPLPSGVYDCTFPTPPGPAQADTQANTCSDRRVDTPIPPRRDPKMAATDGKEPRPQLEERKSNDSVMSFL